MAETICAVATARGSGGTAIIRISGDRALKVLKGAFYPAHSKRAFEPQRMMYGRVEDASGEVLDEALAVFVPGASQLYAGGRRRNSLSWRRNCSAPRNAAADRAGRAHGGAGRIHKARIPERTHRFEPRRGGDAADRRDERSGGARVGAAAGRRRDRICARCVQIAGSNAFADRSMHGFSGRGRGTGDGRDAACGHCVASCGSSRAGAIPEARGFCARVRVSCWQGNRTWANRRL